MKPNQKNQLTGIAGGLLGICISTTIVIPLGLLAMLPGTDRVLERNCIWTFMALALVAGIVLWTGKPFGLWAAKVYFAGLAIVAFAGIFVAINGRGMSDLLVRALIASVVAALGLAYLFTARRVESTYFSVVLPPRQVATAPIPFAAAVAPAAPAPPVAEEGAGDFKFYEQVNRELMRGVKDEILWSQAISRADGNFEQAHNIYITLRVAQLQNQTPLQKTG